MKNLILEGSRVRIILDCTHKNKTGTIFADLGDDSYIVQLDGDKPLDPMLDFLGSDLIIL